MACVCRCFGSWQVSAGCLRLFVTSWINASHSIKQYLGHELSPSLFYWVLPSSLGTVCWIVLDWFGALSIQYCYSYSTILLFFPSFISVYLIQSQYRNKKNNKDSNIIFIILCFVIISLLYIYYVNIVSFYLHSWFLCIGTKQQMCDFIL